MEKNSIKGSHIDAEGIQLQPLSQVPVV